MKLNLKSDLKFHRFAICFFFQIETLTRVSRVRLDIISQGVKNDPAERMLGENASSRDERRRTAGNKLESRASRTFEIREELVRRTEERQLESRGRPDSAELCRQPVV